MCRIFKAKKLEKRRTGLQVEGDGDRREWKRKGWKREMKGRGGNISLEGY